MVISPRKNTFASKARSYNVGGSIADDSGLMGRGQRSLLQR
jgi:hypothetical protein